MVRRRKCGTRRSIRHVYGVPKFSGIPKRMFETIPEAKLLYIVRDPIDRIVSDYVHRFSEGQEARPIS